MSNSLKIKNCLNNLLQRMSEWVKLLLKQINKKISLFYPVLSVILEKWNIWKEYHKLFKLKINIKKMNDILRNFSRKKGELNQI